MSQDQVISNCAEAPKSRTFIGHALETAAESDLFVAGIKPFRDFVLARCLTCFETPDQSPCWHSPPIKLNPKLTVCIWKPPFGWYDSHLHSHYGHVLMPVTIKPSLVFLASDEREHVRLQMQLRTRFLKRQQEL